MISGGDDTTFVFSFAVGPLIANLTVAPLSFLLMVVPYTQTVSDSGECLKIRATQRTNTPLFVIIGSRRDIGTIFSLPRCYRSQLGCACNSYVFVFPRNYEPMNGRDLTYRATAARDGLVKVFDVGAEITTFDSASPHSRGSPTHPGWKQRAIRCHSNSVKRITTELSPDVFLTVSEVSAPFRLRVIVRIQSMGKDGSVRQHDLRAPAHSCASEGGTCSPQLVKVPHRLFSMSIAPTAPHQLVVAGDHPYVCLMLL